MKRTLLTLIFAAVTGLGTFWLISNAWADLFPCTKYEKEYLTSDRRGPFRIEGPKDALCSYKEIDNRELAQIFDKDLPPPHWRSSGHVVFWLLHLAAAGVGALIARAITRPRTGLVPRPGQPSAPMGPPAP